MKRLLFILLICSTFTGFSQETTDSTDAAIRLGFSPQATETTKQDAVPKYLLIKIKKEFVPDFRKIYGKLFKRQLSRQWFVINNQTAVLLTANNQQMVEQITTANDNWKLSPVLSAKKEQLKSGRQDFLVQVNDSRSLKTLINSHGADAAIVYSSDQYHLFTIRTSIAFVEDVLLKEDFVLSVDVRLTGPKEETVINDYDNSANSVNLLFAAFPTVNGENLTVSVKENRFDDNDIDFKNRIKTSGLESQLTSSHATTMATLIGGAGNSFFTGRGVANASTLTSSNFAVLLPDGDNYATNNISVQNHSYGVGIENFYAADAAAYDQSMVDNPALLHVFSAGNIGTSKDSLAGSPYENITGFANISGSFKMAKNILTVGSIDSFFTVSDLSSKGPAYDGRIKPELTAYGNDGSSGAAAITSGTVLAVQSAYKQVHQDSLPDNALTKAFIINSADDINRRGPDYFSGYGNVNAYRAVQDTKTGNFFTGSVADGQTQTFTLTIPANARNLKITLVWTDPAAQANAFTALVNDLDLKLQSRQNVILPWVLNSAPSADSLRKAATKGRDSLNVVEQITLDNPANGSLTISVTGYNVPQGPQKFYVVYRWDVQNDFYFISPAANDHFTTGENSIFRWQSSYASNTSGVLDYSTDNGNTWINISNAVNLGERYIKWTTPSLYTTAIARMTIGNDQYYSDTFNFSKQLTTDVGFNCADSVLITWNKVSGVEGYKVYVLGDKYMEPFTTTTDTSIVLRATQSPFVAVTTLLQNGREGVRSYAFDYTTQGTGCYINNFLADLTTNNTAQLQLSLGTTYNVASIAFQQFTTTGWQTIQTISPVTVVANTYEANTLHAGTNIFRAVVTLNNGQTITSSEATIYYSGGNNKFAFYPNPVSRNGSFTIVSDNFFTNTLMLFDVTGRKVLQQNFNTIRTVIPVSRLARGVYMTVIYTEGVKTYSGKIVVN